MILVQTFSLQQTGATDFDLTFSIPNNSNYSLSYDATKNKNFVTVQLNSGQSQPSGVFVSYTEGYSIYNNLLDITFEQKLNGVTTSKPRTYVQV
ncbi:hypothetical protein LZZ90_10530 [Flavobacterium sp. SM15]|uniref:hypothetical protein n=1 Tax=Flavobacterium sp. SM15 TaxID=2908005 RepID=UPI001EDB733B|nr:hypothetical protein [Flavobacterium sp. SM15]MCG2611942.1 hypothetical protein [Flavobacterium sp. SM15]